MQTKSVVPLVLVLATSGFVALPKKLEAPPGVSGGTECTVGDIHSAQAYAADQLCLMSNTTVAIGVTPSPEEWLRAAAQTSLAIARRAATIPRIRQPEAYYARAVTQAVTHIRAGVASDSLKAQLCGVAASALEAACLSYYCGENVQLSQNELIALAEGEVQDSCLSVPFHCPPRPFDQSYEQCRKALADINAQVDAAAQALSKPEPNDTPLSVVASAAAKRWLEAAVLQRDAVFQAVPTASYAALEPGYLAFLKDVAVPAAIAIRREEIEQDKVQLSELKQSFAAYKTATCASERAYCLERKQLVANAAKQTSAWTEILAQQAGELATIPSTESEATYEQFLRVVIKQTRPNLGALQSTAEGAAFMGSGRPNVGWERLPRKPESITVPP